MNSSRDKVWVWSVWLVFNPNQPKDNAVKHGIRLSRYSASPTSANAYREAYIELARARLAVERYQGKDKTLAYQINPKNFLVKEERFTRTDLELHQTQDTRPNYDRVNEQITNTEDQLYRLMHPTR